MLGVDLDGTRHASPTLVGTVIGAVPVILFDRLCS
jgi:hypothetical protein